MSATPPAEVPTASEHADIEATTLAAESSLLGALRPPYTPQGGSASREAGPPRRNPKTDVFCLNHDSRPKMGCLFICQNLIAISMKPGRAYVVAVRASIERPKLSASVPTEISLRLGPNRYLTRVAIEELLLEAGPNITRAVEKLQEQPDPPDLNATGPPRPPVQDRPVPQAAAPANDVGATREATGEHERQPWYRRQPWRRHG